MSYIYDFAIYMRFCRGLNLKADSSFNGQHNPAQSGGTSGDAKKAFDWMDEDEDVNEEETPSWKD